MLFRSQTTEFDFGLKLETAHIADWRIDDVFSLANLMELLKLYRNDIDPVHRSMVS